MNAMNCPNANNTSLQQQKQAISLRRRPPFHRQDSPHSVAALHIEEPDIDIATKLTSAMHIAIESRSSTVIMEDSLSSIVSNHLMTRRGDSTTCMASDDNEQAQEADGSLQHTDVEQSTTSSRLQQEPMTSTEMVERPTFAPHNSCLKKSPSTSNGTRNTDTKSQRTVHFYETVAIGSIPTLDEYSEVELTSMYYSHDEEQALRSEAKTIVRALRATSTLPCPNQNSLDNDDYCARGLENYLLPREEKRARRILAKEHIYSIIEAQHIMKMEGDGQGVDDSALDLAMISLRSSHGFRDVAMERAAQDETDVKLMLLQQSKAHMAAEAEVQQQRVVAVTRASMTHNSNGTSTTSVSSSRSYSPPLGRNNGSARAACA